jgi:hypothetical protein
MGVPAARFPPPAAHKTLKRHPQVGGLDIRGEVELGAKVSALLTEANEAAERSAALERAAIEDIEDEQARQLAGPCDNHTAA